MDMLLNIVLLLVGFVLLVKGADFFVEGASSISKKLNIPPVIIGLTVVALGTSLPEAAVSIQAALKHNNAIAISNVVGSNLFNLLMVIGICAIFATVTVQKDIIKRDFPLSILLAALVGYFLLDGKVSRVEGLILIAIFVVYIAILVFSAIKGEAGEQENIKEYKMWLSVIFIVGGAAAIVYGGDMVVEYASKIASAIGMSDTLVGLTVVALGTSLPELVTSVVALKKGVVDLAVGNVIGSNIMNILFVLGSSSSISAIAGLPKTALIDFVILTVISLYTYIICLKGKSYNRAKGISMVLLYVIYTAYIICRNYGFLGL